MFLIDKENNKLTKIKQTTFHELGFKEREHLQEWIAKEPTCLEEDGLLIIQKEFDGFDGTNERLDLLALDHSGALVIIENKLDGIDMDWETPGSSHARNYTKLMKVIYEKFKAYDSELLITSAIGAGPWQYNYYDLINSNKYVITFGVLKSLSIYNINILSFISLINSLLLTFKYVLVCFNTFLSLSSIVLASLNNSSVKLSGKR